MRRRKSSFLIMKDRVVLLTVLAVVGPSLALTVLAMRALNDQQIVMERQQAELYQQSAEAAARAVRENLAANQLDFAAQVDSLLGDRNPREVAPEFDALLRQAWPMAQVGFAVTLDGSLLAPSKLDGPAAERFREENSLFLSNAAPAPVYAVDNFAQTAEAPAGAEGTAGSREQSLVGKALAVLNQQTLVRAAKDEKAPAARGYARSRSDVLADRELADAVPETASAVVVKEKQSLDQIVAPSRTADAPAEPPSAASGLLETEVTSEPAAEEPVAAASSLSHADADLRLAQQAQGGMTVTAELVVPPPASAPVEAKQEETAFRGQVQAAAKPSSSWDKADSYGGMSRQRVVTPQKAAPRDQSMALSGFRPEESDFRQLVGESTSGALARFLQDKLRLLFWYRSPVDPQLVFGAQLDMERLINQLRPLLPDEPDIVLALLNDRGQPVALSVPGFIAQWNRPFVAAEIGELLPHWEAAVYLRDPGAFQRSALLLRWSFLGLALLLFILIVSGVFLIVNEMSRELRLAAQKTDFVANVSHELKTPLTSIRMFSDLLAGEGVADPGKRRKYLDIISAEAGRLTRLINNVLDFARLERGDKTYSMEPLDLAAVVADTAESYRPHLETNGYRFETVMPEAPLPVRGDRDALAQVLVNLLSNAEKYGGEAREIRVEISPAADGSAEVRVLDRGPGVPRRHERAIFEKFHRAHDSLASGIQGSGLGLTLSRQIARAHGGDVTYAPRPGGGSCFTLTLPLENPS